MTTKCTELNSFLDPTADHDPKRIILNKTLPEKVAAILCSGPKFTEGESRALTKILYEMQETFTETKVCLPKHFDVCLNIDWIFSYTYVKDKDGLIQPVDMSHVLPIRCDTIAKVASNLCSNDNDCPLFQLSIEQITAQLLRRQSNG